MPRSKKLAVSALNLRIVAPAKRDYVALFNALMQLKRPVRVRGNDYILMTKFGKIGAADPEIEFGGVLGKYTEIDPDGDWLDMHLLTEAGENRLSEITIPEDLKPNYEPFLFIVFPREHILVFESFSESRSLGPTLALKWLSRVTRNKKIKREFGDIDVDAVPDFDALAGILEAESLRRLEIYIKRVNPDDYDLKDFKRTEERLRAINAASETTIYVPPPQEELKLNMETKALARVGAENGVVSGRIELDGTVVPVSTANHPIHVQEVYDADEVPTEAFFRSLAVKVRGLVRRNRRARQQ